MRSFLLASLALGLLSLEAWPVAFVAFPVASAQTRSGGVVSDFTAPYLRGLSVRDHPHGVEVVSPVGEGAFSRYRPGDVITRVNDQPVGNAARFRDVMNELHRNNAGFSLATLAAAPRPATANVIEAPSYLLGFGVRDHRSGVEVTTPAREGPLARHRAGEVLTHVNGQPVCNTAHFGELITDAHRSGNEISFTTLPASTQSAGGVPWATAPCLTAPYLRGLAVRDHVYGAEILTAARDGELAQFRAGDVITAVNDRPVHSAAMFMAMMDEVRRSGAGFSLSTFTP